MPNTDHLDTISLDDLNAAASLLTRVDRKYLVPQETAQGLVDDLAPRARVLRIGDLRAFRYASTCFDTPALDSFFRAARKRRRRFKIRTRVYLDSGLCFLEVKTNGSREETVKDRIEYTYDDADRLTPEGQDFVVERLVESETCRPAEARAVAEALVPVMDIHYERTTLHLPTDDARTTIDTALTWDLFDDDGERLEQRVWAGPLAIVETKNPSTASPTDRLLWGRGHRPTRISKYATGMAMLHEDLPTNRWHRTINRDLGGCRPAAVHRRRCA